MTSFTWFVLRISLINIGYKSFQKTLQQHAAFSFFLGPGFTAILVFVTFGV
jgi:hypothetical protein